MARGWCWHDGWTITAKDAILSKDEGVRRGRPSTPLVVANPEPPSAVYGYEGFVALTKMQSGSSATQKSPPGTSTQSPPAHQYVLQVQQREQ